VRELRRALLALMLAASCAATAACAAREDALSGDTCHGREATIIGTDGDDRLNGTTGPDVIVARDGDDRVRGLGGDDVLCGGPGADRLSGGDGDDELYGELDGRRARGGGDYVWRGDTLAGGLGDDVLDGGIDDAHPADEAGDTVSFTDAGRGVVVDLARGRARGEGRDELAGSIRHVVGSSHDDRLLGDQTANELTGGDGADELDGRGGDDDLRGVGGADRLYGGPGDDRLGDTVTPDPGQLADGGPGAADTVVGVAFVADGVTVDDATGTLDLTAGLGTASSPTGGTWSLQLPGVEQVSPRLAASFTVVGATVPGQEPTGTPSAEPTGVPGSSASPESPTASGSESPASPTASP
jgi:Ca2+-binding RTX toxin-like protein